MIHTLTIKTFKQVKDLNFKQDALKVKHEAKNHVIEVMKNFLYKVDNEGAYEDFKKILKIVQNTINNGGGNIQYEALSISSLFNSTQFLNNLEIICTHKNQALGYFNSDKKLNFGFGKYKDVNYTNTAISLLEEIEIIKNDLPIKAFPDGVTSIVFEYSNLFEAENITTAYNFKSEILTKRKNDLAQEYKNLYLKDDFLNREMSTEEIIHAFKNGDNLKDPQLLLAAAATGDNELILFFIKAKFDLNQYFPIISGNYTIWKTALYTALINNQMETIKLLVKNGADVNKFIIEAYDEDDFDGGGSSNYTKKKTPLRISYEKTNQEASYILGQLGGKCIYKEILWEIKESYWLNGEHYVYGPRKEKTIKGWK